jgi:hypothetical protein
VRQTKCKTCIPTVTIPQNSPHSSLRARPAQCNRASTQTTVISHLSIANVNFLDPCHPKSFHQLFLIIKTGTS